MKKNKGRTISELSGSRRVWQLKPEVRVIQSGKVYDRKKRVNDSENKELKNINICCI